MTNKEEIERNLNERTTEELKNWLKNRELSEETLPIAARILEIRGESVPEVISEEEIKSDEELKNKKFVKNVLSTVAAICGWIGYGIISGEFELRHQETLNRSVLCLAWVLSGIWGWQIFGGKKK